MPAQVHQDIQQLTGAVRELADTLKPLKALADHVPALIEMAQVWNAGKKGGHAVGQFGDLAGAVAKWISSVGVAVAVLWLVIHARWEQVLKGVAP